MQTASGLILHSRVLPPRTRLSHELLPRYQAARQHDALLRAAAPHPQFASSYVTRSDGDGDTTPRSSKVQKRAGAVTFDSSFTWSNNRANYLNTFDPYTVTRHWTRDSPTAGSTSAPA